MREASIEAALTLGVKDFGWCIKLVPFYQVGLPDRMILLSGGRCIFVETKAPNGVVRSWQKRLHERLRTLGFRVEILWTMTQVRTFLDEIRA